MSTKRRTMLYFGSFNPVHNGHIALAEYVVGKGLCDDVVLVVSPQSPYKRAFDLAPEMDRFEMAERACAASRCPDRIKASAVEFLLPRPSYTIDTLRFLEEQAGERMSFAILMGADQLAGLGGWKEAEEVLRYPLYVYPRREADTAELPEGATLLAEAPLFDISATEIRRRISDGEPVDTLVAPAVAAYVREKRLWNMGKRLLALGDAIAAEPDDAELRIERGKCYYRLNRWGDALNDFNAALALDGENTEARQYAEMVREILAFRYTDIYNP